MGVETYEIERLELAYENYELAKLNARQAAKANGLDTRTFYLKAKSHEPSVGVELVVKRNGEYINLLAPGGRLGAKINHIRVSPSG